MKSVFPPRIGRVLRLFVFAFALCCLTLGSACAAPPNVIVLLADDAGWGDTSFSGNRQVSTPHIDSIARQGASLERFYVCPVCSPTRAEFLTGRYYPRTGVRGVSTGQERLDLAEKTIADAFQAAGYATGAFGKWHNGSQWPYHPLARGFGEYFGYTSGHWGEYFNPPLEENGRMVRTEGYIVDICTDRALRFIDQHKDRPFFCYVPFTTPHTPWAVPPEYWERFKNKPIEQRGSENSDKHIDATRCALAMLENQDWNVGRILARVREHGLEDNTIIVYFSDNGPNSPRWNGGMRGIKGSTDEGGVRSVCYIRYPAKIAPGRSIGGISAALDLLPTLTSLAGVPRIGELPLDGRDLSPVLLQKQDPDPDRMIFSVWGGKVSVRTPRYRLDATGSLYDMELDPGQKTPINAQEPGMTDKLIAVATEWKKEMPSPESKPLPFPVGYREFPVTMLPARDGVPVGSVRRSSKHPNSSYFENWTSLEDRMLWQIDVHTTGTYRVSIDYTCPEKDIGSTIEIAFGGERLSTKVGPAWDPPLSTDNDTIPRGPHGESPMKEFHSLEAGTLLLKKGANLLTLRATEIPGSSVMDVRRITLTLLPGNHTP